MHFPFLFQDLQPSPYTSIPAHPSLLPHVPPWNIYQVPVAPVPALSLLPLITVSGTQHKTHGGGRRKPPYKVWTCMQGPTPLLPHSFPGVPQVLTLRHIQTRPCPQAPSARAQGQPFTLLTCISLVGLHLPRDSNPSTVTVPQTAPAHTIGTSFTSLQGTLHMESRQ